MGINPTHTGTYRAISLLLNVVPMPIAVDAALLRLQLQVTHEED